MGYLAGQQALRPDLMHSRGALGAGVYDGLSSLIASRYDFDFLWLSSFCLSAAHGMPDAGLLDARVRAQTVAMIRLLSSLPIVVDMDAAADDPVKTFVEVRELIRNGADAVCIEDVVQRKRSSLYDAHPHQLASVEDHLTRIRSAAAAFAAEGKPSGVISRSEALVAGAGLDEAITRSRAALKTGACAVFVQSLDATGGEVLAFCTQWANGRRAPVFLAPTRFSTVSRRVLFEAGATHLIFANQTIRAAHRAMDDVLRRVGQIADLDLGDGISPVSGIAREVGADALLDLECQLDPVRETMKELASDRR